MLSRNMRLWPHIYKKKLPRCRWHENKPRSWYNDSDSYWSKWELSAKISILVIDFDYLSLLSTKKVSLTSWAPVSSSRKEIFHYWFRRKLVAYLAQSRSMMKVLVNVNIKIRINLIGLITYNRCTRGALYARLYDTRSIAYTSLLYSANLYV